MGGQADLSYLPISPLTSTVMVNLTFKSMAEFAKPPPPHASLQAAMTLGPPGKVSPLIKAGRWTLLIAGITYGYYRHNYLSEIEKVQQAEDDKIRAVLAQRAAERDAQAQADGLNEIAPAFGVTKRVKPEDFLPKKE